MKLALKWRLMNIKIMRRHSELLLKLTGIDDDDDDDDDNDDDDDDDNEG